MLKVYLVEDEHISRAAVRKMLESFEDVEVVGEAEDGASAIEQVPYLMPHVVIADIHMPGMDGLDMAEWIRRTYPDIMIVFLTGHSDFPLAQRAIKLGASDYILKPTKKEDLWEALSRVRQKWFGASKEQSCLMFQLNQQQLDVNQEIAQVYGYHLPGVINCRKLILQAVEYINKHYALEITLKHMSDVLFVNQTYFSEVFKSETGVTFNDYLTIVRTEKVKQLLIQNRELKLYSIAEMVGYKDAKYLSQLFRKVVGCTPNEFRNSH